MRSRKSIVYLFFFLLPGCDASDDEVVEYQTEPWFEEAEHPGVGFQHNSGSTGDFLMPEIMGGGVALIDVDGDQDLDLYFVQGGPGLTKAGEQLMGNELY